MQHKLTKENVMKELNVAQADLVSGGDYELTLTMHVPSDIAPQLATIIEEMILGQIADINGFVKALSSAGPTLNEVHIDNISFSNFK